MVYSLSLLLTMIFFDMISHNWFSSKINYNRKSEGCEMNSSYKNNRLFIIGELSFIWTCLIYMPILIHIKTHGLNIQQLILFICMYIANCVIRGFVYNNEMKKRDINILTEHTISIIQILLTGGIWLNSWSSRKMFDVVFSMNEVDDSHEIIIRIW